VPDKNRKLAALRERLERAWSRSTSAEPTVWTASNPAWGQCAITALVVQDHFGGELLRGQMREGSHYWNRLADGTDVDLTLQQFSESPEFLNVETRSRDEVLAHPDTASRYNILKRRCSDSMAA
jgi:hypothetical protein